LAQPFLNAADSTLTLNYGSYYAIAFLGFGQHIGAGSISFLLNGVTPYSQDVTFPDPRFASPVFASFALPGGDEVEVSATGLSADRIRIVADGGGLFTDGTPDAFYLFNFTSGDQQTPEPATGVLVAGGLLAAWAVRRRLPRK
jgi:MYXO-CTERM domain-containing protein